MVVGLIYVFDLTHKKNKKKIVKVGSTELREGETIDQVQGRLLVKYGKVCVKPEMLDGVLVTDIVKGKKKMMKLISELHVVRKLYCYDEKRITKALDKVYDKFGIDEGYDVEDIVGYDFETGLFKIKWVGYPDTTFEPFTNLKGCQEIVNEFANNNILIK